MATLQASARLLITAGFAGAIATAPAIAVFVGPILSPAPAAQTVADPTCTSNQRNVSYYLDCSPNIGTGGWHPFNDWNGGAPSESSLTNQNMTRH
jgi:hypothetical protein